MIASASIRRLDQPVADAIAAGEVVERPASVVKELCENALDAGATRVDVELAAAGITRIRVSDNGGGIAPGELVLAMARHATSKITGADDLHEVTTLGFRGEALASIAAVSEVTLTSRRPSDPGGAMIRVRGGDVAAQSPASAAPGTTVEVCDLFVTTPARLRFLKSERTEVGAATRVVADLALSRPDAAFTCRVDGRTVVRTPGGSLRDALRAVLGAASAAELLDVDAPGDPGVTGAISEPRAHRAARNAVVLIVNGRRISHRGLTVAIEDAYRGLLPTGRFPYGVLAIDIDPTSVDVNVHPAKREVRFRDERAVFSAVQRACWHALQGSRPGVVAPGWSAGGAGTLGMLHVRDGGPASLPPGPPGSDGGGAAGALPVPPESLWPSRSAAHGQVPGPVPAEYGADASPVPPFAPDGAVQSAPGESWTDAGDAGRAAIHGAPAATVSGLPAMRAVGQVASTWMVAEAAGGVVLVDPHAAHEKVLYAELIEQWRAAPLGDGTAQLLLLPVAIECDPRQMAAGLAASDFLTRCGFILEEFGPGTLRCSAVPAVAGNADAGRLVADLLDQLADDSGPVHERQHRIAALIACHSAVRFGDPVGPAEQQRLLHRLVATAGGQTCPHGRPTVLVLDDAALRRAFRRPAAR